MEEYNEIFAVESAIDQILQSRNLEDDQTRSMRELTDKGRAANALPFPVQAGTRVRFVVNLGSVLSYDNVPGDGVEGTVILVKSAEGKVTSSGERVFVSWDDGVFRPILAEHLRPASASKRIARNVAIRTAEISFLSNHFEAHSSHSDELVHRATKDLWSFRNEGEGYVIERLFDSNGKPLKV